MDQERGSAYNFVDTRALVVGLAREGTALARFLAERGARVTVTDAKPAGALSGSVEALADLPVTFALGGHPLSLLDGADLLFVSPGVPLEIPFLVEARRRRLPLSSETRLFACLCPALVVGITGSSGKTTTAALLGEVFRAAGRRTWVGGNIGRPLIGHLDEIGPADVVVMELSSFQLEFFAPWTGPGESVLFDPSGWSPPVAAVLNITPNHLDRHGTMEAYVAAKAHILAHQRPGGVAVLDLDNQVTRAMGGRAVDEGRRVLWFSLEQEVGEGAWLRGDELVLSLAGRAETVCRAGDLKLLGRHNLANALAACSLAAAVSIVSHANTGSRADTTSRRGSGWEDLPFDALCRTVTSFRGVEHRLELVRERDGVRWYNDSIATAPERTVAALHSFDRPIVLLAGGRDKHLPWDEMAALTWNRVRHLILFGEAAGLIERAMDGVAPDPALGLRGTCIHHAGTLPRAVELAAELARPGDVVLLSPGGTSFDAYPDFVARGAHFRQVVGALE